MRPGTADTVQTTTAMSIVGKERVEQWALESHHDLIGIFPIYLGAAEKLAAEYGLNPVLAIVLQIIAFASEKQISEVVLDNEDCDHAPLAEIREHLRKANIKMSVCSEG